MKYCIALLIFLIFKPCLAQTYKLPKGTHLEIKQGVFRGYTLDEFKIILHIEADYRAWAKQIPLLRKQVNEYDSLVNNQTKQLELQEKHIKILKTERERLLKKWEEENKLRHLAENKPNFGSWLSWGAAAVMTATTAVLAGVLVAR